MPSHSSFTAEPSRRYAAFFADTLATFLLFLIVGTVGDGLHVDLARWDVFALVWVLYQGFSLELNQGQTFGRYLANIVVCGETGSSLASHQAYLRSLIRALPLVLFEGPPPVAIAGYLALLALFVAETSLLEKSATRQTVADRLVKSLVVNLPPPHTHRAPAGPMYSATDGEFGNPPKQPPK